MKESIIIALLVLIIIIVFIGTAYIMVFYYEYRCDKDKLKENRETIKELTLLMAKKEGLQLVSNEPPKEKVKKVPLFNIFQ